MQPGVEIITKQKARRLVTNTGWVLIKQGKESYSKDMRWLVYSAGQGQYRRKPCNPNW